MIDRLALAAGAALIGLWVAAPVAPAQTVDTKQAAQESKTPQDVDIEADNLQVLDKEKKAIFTGNVNAKRGATRLKSNSLVVTYQETTQANNEKKNEVTFLDATGNVIIVTSSQTITGDKAHMDVKANTVTVEGGVKVVQGQTVVQGQKLFADLNTNKSTMTGGRVRGSFVPSR